MEKRFTVKLIDTDNRIVVTRGEGGWGEDEGDNMQNTEFIVVLLFINYCFFHMNNCKHTLPHPVQD